MIAPIVLFVYNRPWHTQKTIEALKANFLASESDLIIFSDAPKNPESKHSVEEVRQIIRGVEGFKSISIHERATNFGLAKSVIEGVSDILKTHDSVIVLEDDLVTSPYFLTYMNNALEMYKDDENVASIHGYIYPIEGLPETFFIKGADCWGWATWKRAWKHFESDGEKLQKALKDSNLQFEFDFNGSYNYSKMLDEFVNKKNDSWAIRWYASAFLNNMLTLYPGVSFVQNIGNDNSGTHSISNAQYSVVLNDIYNKITKIPNTESVESKRKIINYFNSINSIKKSQKFKKKLKSLIPTPALSLLKKLKGTEHGWIGDFKTWEDAEKKCSGYNQDIIFNKVKDAATQVKEGKALYERDGVLFYEENPNYDLQKVFKQVYNLSDNKFHLVDFGGSLGSMYFQNRKLLSEFNNVQWSVVEQPKFVEIGKKDFSDHQLHFHNTIEECFAGRSPNILLLGSVLQYFKNPYELLDHLTKHNFEFIIVDRTPFSKNNTHRITKQVVHPSIYRASYPCHLFSESEMKAKFAQIGFEIISEFSDPAEIIPNITLKGFLLRNKAYEQRF